VAGDKCVRYSRWSFLFTMASMVIVVNSVLGHVTGDVLVRSPDVPTISFTGSTATGKDIMAAASANLKRVGLELGGKTPLIVFDDADPGLALPIVVSALIVFSGQFCMTGSRLLVREQIADRVRTELGARLQAVRVGPASDPKSHIGLIIDKPNVERIHKIVQDAISAGAKVIVRGGPVTDGPPAAGAFYRPTLLEVADNSMSIVQDEVFGPVPTMQTFTTEAEAIALANDSAYGLSASVFSRDIAVPLRVALALESGSVWGQRLGPAPRPVRRRWLQGQRCRPHARLRGDRRLHRVQAHPPPTEQHAAGALTASA
jgi:betaine-aldehyde dehydrogenase